MIRILVFCLLGLVAACSSKPYPFTPLERLKGTWSVTGVSIDTGADMSLEELVFLTLVASDTTIFPVYLTLDDHTLNMTDKKGELLLSEGCSLEYSKERFQQVTIQAGPKPTGLILSSPEPNRMLVRSGNIIYNCIR